MAGLAVAERADLGIVLHHPLGKIIMLMSKKAGLGDSDGDLLPPQCGQTPIGHSIAHYPGRICAQIVADLAGILRWQLGVLAKMILKAGLPHSSKYCC